MSAKIVDRLGLCGARFILTFYNHRRPQVGGVIKLARFPIRHSNASVRCRLPRQVALVQSVARRELDKIRHRGAHEVGMRWFGVAPAIDVGFHDSARIINVVTIKAGAMIFVFANDLKTTSRCAVAFATTGYAGRRGYISRAVDIGFLVPQAHDDGRPAGMTLR